MRVPDHELYGEAASRAGQHFAGAVLRRNAMDVSWLASAYAAAFYAGARYAETPRRRWRWFGEERVRPVATRQIPGLVLAVRRQIMFQMFPTATGEFRTELLGAIGNGFVAGVVHMECIHGLVAR